MKKLLSIILTIVLLLSIVPLGTVMVSAATTWQTIPSNLYVYDTLTYKGVTTNAYYPKSSETYVGKYDTDSTYSCAALIVRFFNNYGIAIRVPISGMPSVTDGSGSFNRVYSPSIGDVLRLPNKHWAIVKAVSGNTITVFEQNYYWDNGGKLYAGKDRTITQSQIDNETWILYRCSSFEKYNSKPILTIKYNANGGYIKSEKKDEIFIDSKGLMLKYSTNDYYANNWEYGTSYSNGLINASSFGVVRDGYKFVGWSLSKSGGTVYDQTTARKPEEIYPDLKNGSATITMYAVWETNVLGVKYNVNGGIIDSDAYYMNNSLVYRKSSLSVLEDNWKYNSAHKNGLYNASTFGLSKAGYSFKGWKVGSSGKIVFGQNDATVVPTDLTSSIKTGSCTITLYAVWEPNELKVICNANGGKVTSSKYYTDSEEMIINRETSKPSTTYWYYGEKRENGFTDNTTFGLSKKCHEFVGWSLSKEGVKVYDKAASLAPEIIYPDIKKGDATITVYAIWRETNHTYSNTSDTTCNVCSKSRAVTTNKIKSVKLSTNEYTYNGKAKKPSVKVYDAKGNKLKKDVDYTVKYASGRKKVGKYKVTITFKGNYSGTKTLYFKINPKETKVSSVSAGKKSLKVKIKKQSSQTTGYQIQYSTSKKFTSAKTKTTSKTSYTIKSLKAKKTYYIRVRTYKTVGGKKYYSDWSSYKYKKTK